MIGNSELPGLSAVGAAECHGVLAGALAAGETPAAAAELASALVDACDAASLGSWAQSLKIELGEAQLAFQPWLPDDEQPLAVRVEALAAWVRGFLSGLGQAGLRVHDLGAQVAETLSDLDAIARGAAVMEGGSEAEEQAYTALVEYVRLAVQTLFESLNPGRNARHGKMTP